LSFTRAVPPDDDEVALPADRCIGKIPAIRIAHKQVRDLQTAKWMAPRIPFRSNIMDFDQASCDAIEICM